MVPGTILKSYSYLFVAPCCIPAILSSISFTSKRHNFPNLNPGNFPSAAKPQMVASFSFRKSAISFTIIHFLAQSCAHVYDPSIDLFILPNFSASRIIPPILDSDSPNFSLSDAMEISLGFCLATSTIVL
jgi:hypothetical protein